MTRHDVVGFLLLLAIASAGLPCAGDPAYVAAAAEAEPSSVLRVCADPNNLPFSNDRGEGFENAIAAMLARDLGSRLEYTWWAQRRGFLRNTLNAGLCDLVIGVPAGSDALATTRSYYRSSYVFVTRAGVEEPLRSFDDARLRTWRIGVPLLGDDGGAPPALALSRRGIVRNVAGYSIYGDYRDDSPPSRLIAAVASGEIDVALAWGPTAGYFAARQSKPLAIAPVAAVDPVTSLPMTFAIAMGARRADRDRVDAVEAFLDRRRAGIDRLLERFGVPRVDGEAAR